MDTSETYIKQCKKAWEIQKLYPTGNYKTPNLCFYNGEFLLMTNLKPGVWLPYQDQLQKMLKLELYQTYSAFDRWLLKELYEKKSDLYASMEQLWLAFVQKELHNKVWDGEEWVL